ncbi:hypothetical protein EV359DRAFT_51346 [Lentinula novae-zelandiae]|nr:hypothetical protein EV359DRAFT_51346 [Lentinula novae-zelandiae]
MDSRLELLFKHTVVDARHQDHRRGKYTTLPAGCGFGGGRILPGNYANTAHNEPLVDAVLSDLAVQRVARYIDSELFPSCSWLLLTSHPITGLQTYWPKLHQFLSNLLEHILMDCLDIQRLFAGCCYGACHFNLHNATTLDHEDYYNILFALCAVYASGRYDHTRSGHLIAWSLRIVAQFPAGSAAFLPSACVTHANTPIDSKSGEHRSSIAFFTLAGLARWYHNGYMSDKEFMERVSPRQLSAWKDCRSRLWEAGLELLQYD